MTEVTIPTYLLGTRADHVLAEELGHAQCTVTRHRWAAGVPAVRLHERVWRRYLTALHAARFTGLTTCELAAQLGVARQTALNNLSRLYAKGWITRHRACVPQTRWVWRWYATEAAPPLTTARPR